jgi:hypothetical protein
VINQPSFRLSGGTERAQRAAALRAARHHALSDRRFVREKMFDPKVVEPRGIAEPQPQAAAS